MNLDTDVTIGWMSNFYRLAIWFHILIKSSVWRNQANPQKTVYIKKMIEWGKQLWIKQSYHLAFRGAVGDVNGNWLQVATKWKEWRDIRIMVNIFFSVFNYLWATILAWFLTNLPKKNQFELKTSTPNSYWHLFEI